MFKHRRLGIYLGRQNLSEHPECVVELLLIDLKGDVLEVEVTVALLCADVVLVVPHHANRLSTEVLVI